MSEDKTVGFVKYPLITKIQGKQLLNIPDEDRIQRTQTAALEEFQSMAFMGPGNFTNLKNQEDFPVLMDYLLRGASKAVDEKLELFTDGASTGQQHVQARLAAAMSIITGTISMVRDGEHPIAQIAYMKTYCDMVFNAMIIANLHDIHHVDVENKINHREENIRLGESIFDTGPPSALMTLKFIQSMIIATGGDASKIKGVQLNASDIEGIDGEADEIKIMAKAKELATRFSAETGQEVTAKQIFDAILNARKSGMSMVAIGKNKKDK